MTNRTITTTTEPTSRRAFIGMASGLAAAAIATTAVAVQSAKAGGKTDKLDADLLELGNEFDRLLEISINLRRAFNPIQDRFDAILKEEGRGLDLHRCFLNASVRERAEARCPERGKAWAALNENAIAIEEVIEKVLPAEPQSLAGVLVQLRVLRYRVTDDGLFRDDGEGNIDDPQVYDCFTSLMASVEDAVRRETGLK